MSSIALPDTLSSFFAAMHSRDTDELAQACEGMTEDVILNSPIVAKPFEGRVQVSQVLKALFSIADSFTIRDTLSIVSGWFAALVSIGAGDTQVGGVYYATLNEEGKISSMTIHWRALPEIVAMQNKIAPFTGGQALILTPKPA